MDDCEDYMFWDSLASQLQHNPKVAQWSSSGDTTSVCHMWYEENQESVSHYCMDSMD